MELCKNVLHIIDNMKVDVESGGMMVMGFEKVEIIDDTGVVVMVEGKPKVELQAKASVLPSGMGLGAVRNE